MGRPAWRRQRWRTSCGSQLPVPARVVTMSIKERTAITLAGRRADAVTWFNRAAGGFVTSSAYTQTPVPFVEAFTKANPVTADLGKVWTRSLPAERYLFADAGRGEKPAAFWSAEFPHALKGKGDAPDEQFFEAWEGSPYLGRLPRAPRDGVGRRPEAGAGQRAPTFSGSASRRSITWATTSARPVTRCRTRSPASTAPSARCWTTSIAPSAPASTWSRSTADHGAAPIPEQAAALGIDAGRLDVTLLRQAAQRALEAALEPGTHTVRIQGSDLIFEPQIVERLRRDPRALDEVLRAVRAVPGVASAFFAEQLDSHAAAGDRDARAALLSYYPGRSGDVVVLPKPYWFFVTADGSPQPGSATSHGTMYGYDQRVPIVLYGRGIRPGEFTRAVTPADIAPTLAYLCGVTLAHADGEVLTEAIAQPAPAATRGR